MLPKGQFDLGDFPRFGLPQYADRFPTKTDAVEISFGGECINPFILAEKWHDLPRTSVTANFHCVTTWSALNLEWSGVLFKDIFDQLILSQSRFDNLVEKNFYINIKCQDGYASCLPLSDMIKDNVILADRLFDEPLSIAHGAPLRLVAPDHYGYKNPKHIYSIDFHREPVRPARRLDRFLAHPRGRVAKEERGVGLPGWALRYLYRQLIGSTRKQFQTALEKHEAKGEK